MGNWWIDGGVPLLRGLALADATARPILAVRPSGLEALCDSMAAAERAWIEACGFRAGSREVLAVPGEAGIGCALLGLGERETGPFGFGTLSGRLPAEAWRVDEEALGQAGASAHEAVLGFLLGAYRVRGEAYDATLVAPESATLAVATARAVTLARDLINAPPNTLGPSELADAVGRVAHRFGAAFHRIDGATLAAAFPAVAAVGAGSVRGPVVASFAWRGSKAGEGAPLVSLVGKGVCFDTGGYDIKNPAGMLRMKKDMGGAATLLGVAALVMERDLPVRLELRVPCVENSISGAAMRPSDVIATRAGLTVEVGNTDAEGRLVLADLLADAAAGAPAVLVDMATLTGAARIALGPDLPALFTDDDGLASALIEAGVRVHDPLWRMPLWNGYDAWLDSDVADLSNVSGKTHAGAVTAALFLRRFVPAGTPWAHLDAYCWNDSSSPGRPEGGEATGLRAVYEMITNLCDDGT